MVWVIFFAETSVPFSCVTRRGAAVDIHPVLRTYTFEVIGRVGFGQKFDAITKPEECDSFVTSKP